MDDMVERVARSIDGVLERYQDSMSSPSFRDVCAAEAARAAIEAMRVPPPDIINALIDGWHSVRLDNARAAYEAMIDAALTP